MSALREAPKPWLSEGSGAPRGAKALLQSGLDVDPGPDEKDAVWAALALKIGPVGGAAQGGSGSGSGQGGSALHDGGAGTQALTGKAASVGSAAGKGLLAGTVKSAALGALAAAAVAFGYDAVVPSEQPSTVVSTQSVAAPPEAAAPLVKGAQAVPDVAPTAAPAAPPPAIEPAIGAGAAPAPEGANKVAFAGSTGAPSTDHHEAPASAPLPDTTGFEASQEAPSGAGAAAAPVVDAVEARRSRLREEAAVIADARGALRSGNPGQALVLLEAARIRFPDGVLGQEREALSIEALARGGQSSAASARARAFLAAYPNSAHAEHIQSFVGH